MGLNSSFGIAMKISLIIPAYNEEKEIAACLRAAIKNAPENLVEVLVVDNASTDQTAAIASKVSPKIKVVPEPKKGLTCARQRGYQEAKGDVLAFIDADTRMPKGWFEILNREFAKDRSVVCLSGPYYYYDIPVWQRALIHASYRYFFRPTYSVTNSIVIGGNFAVKKEAIRKIGGFDVTIPFYGEDTDLAVRLKKIGKIQFLNEFYIATSGRRFVEEGFFRTGVVYIINYVWQFLFQKPFTKKYKDVRN